MESTISQTCFAKSAAPLPPSDQCDEILHSTFKFLQKSIIVGVYKKSNGVYNIGYQDQDVLKTIMRAMYLQHSKNLDEHITSQIRELNNFVVNYAIPQIYNEAESYIKFKQQVSNISNPIDLPKSSYHSNTLIMKPFF